MFDIGFAELLIVAVVALIVLGPERLPRALKTAGMWLGRIKRTVTSVQKEISEELRVEEMRRAAKEQQERLEQDAHNMTRPFNESLRDEILAPQQEAAPTPAEPVKPTETSAGLVSESGAEPAQQKKHSS